MLMARGTMFSGQQVIAHRGASAHAPENTFAAFNKALDLGCRWVEFDVMLNADNEAFVFHDEDIKRITRQKGAFALLSSAEVESLDVGRWFSKRFSGEKIPRFDEVIRWLTAQDVQANIEIKPTSGQSEKTTMVVLTTLQRFWPKNKPLPLISSFDLSVLRLCRTIMPEWPLALLLEKWDEQWQKWADELHCFSIHLPRRAVTHDRVQRIREQGYAVAVYTVNRPRLARRLFGWGVQAVFSDYPELLTKKGWI